MLTNKDLLWIARDFGSRDLADALIRDSGKRLERLRDQAKAPAERGAIVSARNVLDALVRGAQSPLVMAHHAEMDRIAARTKEKEEGWRCTQDT